MNFPSLKKSIVVWVFFCIQLFSFLSVLNADIRYVRTDAAVINDAKLIVVGHLKDDIKRIDYKNTHRHRATLVVHEILKGELEEDTIEILILSSMKVTTDNNSTSIVGGYSSLRHIVAADVQDDHIYCLRKTRAGDGNNDEPSFWAIADIQDAAEVKLKDYFQVLLSDKPEAGLRELLKTQPELAHRAVEFLDHRELQRIMADPVPAKRFQKIMPYYLGATHKSTRSIARRCLLKGGPESGPYLMAGLENCRDRYKREEIIRILASTKYRGAKDYITQLINTNHLKLMNGQWPLEESAQQRAFKNLNSEIQECREYLDKIED